MTKNILNYLTNYCLQHVFINNNHLDFSPNEKITKQHHPITN